MFGKRLRELTPIKQVVATYAGRAAEKLRAQGAVCKRIRGSIRTGMFNPNEFHHVQGVLVELPYPTNDTLLLIRAATEAVERVFETGYRCSKAEVSLLELRQPGEFSDDLFAASHPAASPAPPDWEMRRDIMRQSYTTWIDQLWAVSSR